MKREKEILEALKKSVVDPDEKLLMQTIDAAEHAEAPVTESWAEEISADT
ncbi:MAG: hypothetical protein OEW95_10925 [Candidatus Bathyarchaeota archaeon]|nr:hypothetical protein [Candidatus Bathyarchaeota archaeon]MDH5713585.1 hypothetical protein [Candidatus Bathyarchaeota archaeon]